MPTKDKYSKKHKWNAYDMPPSEIEGSWMKGRKYKICVKCGLIMYNTYGNNWYPYNEEEKTTCDKRRMFNALE